MTDKDIWDIVEAIQSSCDCRRCISSFQTQEDSQRIDCASEWDNLCY